jgi:predicted ATP-grasp superfamily ATP-dependent carboligase
MTRMKLPVEIPAADKPYAIVIGLDCFTGLQTARILARRKAPVIGIGGNDQHPCFQTRVCQAKFTADIGSLDFIELLGAIGPRLGEKAVLYPCTDMSVLLISRNRNRLKDWFHIALPDEDTVEMLMDKVRFYTFCQREGFPIPATHFLKNLADAESAAANLNFPAILKPPMKTPTWEANSKSKVYKIASAEALLKIYKETHQWADMLMVQEWIEGGDDTLYSLNCYFSAESKALATFVARKIRQWPPETGTSSLGEEVRNDVVLEESLKLLEYVNYRGLGYVEMKRDSRTGHHYIIEPNIGRPTGRSAISEAGGVELLYTKYCDLLGLPLPENRVQQYKGVKWIYLRRDLQSAWAYWKRGKLTFKEWRKSMKGKKYYALFSWSDPRPFIEDLRATFIKNRLKKSNDKSESRAKTSPKRAAEVKIK